MIKRIELKNFESHANTVYDNLSGGFNLFRGESDSGKSSVFRAVKVCAYNDWNEEMVRLGEKHSEISIDTEKGSVKAIRGGGKNEWYITEKTEGTNKEHFFEKIGKTVPEVVTKVLGMPRLDIAGIKETPNMMLQLDKHYMISEVDGKKCSANMVAQIVDEILGLTGTEKLINDISLDGKRAKKEAKENGEQVEILKEQLHDEDFIKNKKDLLSSCQKLETEYSSKKDKCDDLRRAVSRHNSLLEKKKRVSDKLIEYKSLNDSIEKFKILNNNHELYKKYKTTFDRIVVLKTKVESYKKKISKMPDFTALIVKKTKLKGLQNKYDDMVVFQSRIKREEKKLNLLHESLKIATNGLANAKIEWDEFRKENPNCPTCGATLKEELCC